MSFIYGCSGLRKDIIFISSSGGHYKQIKLVEKLIKNNLKKTDYDFISTENNKLVQCSLKKISGTPLDKLLNIIDSFFFAYRFAPRIVITTGSGDVLPFVLFSRLLGAKVLFIDSIHNVKELSSTGNIINKLRLGKVVVQHDNGKGEYWGRLI